jgi:predicted nuclease of predicted toxin-antitoxin system
MKVRFQADADLNQIVLLATVRREPAIDFQTALGAALAGVGDPEVLAIAARKGRILVTHDHKTMPRHFGQYVTTNTSPGVLVVPQNLSVAAAAQELLLVWSATEAEEWINRICFLPL